MCAWSSPQTFTTGQIVEASDLNADIRDNTRFLKGLDGTVTIEDSVIIATAAGKYLQVPSMTTANLPASPAAGMIVYDSTVGLYKKYINGAWASLVGQAAVGSAGQFLKSNGAGVTPSWDNLGADVAVAPVTYTGNSTDEQDLAVVAVPTIGGILRFVGHCRLDTGTLTLRFYNAAAALVSGYGIAVITFAAGDANQYAVNGSSVVLTGSGAAANRGVFEAFLVPASTGNFKITAQYSVGDADHTVTATGFWTP